MLQGQVTGQLTHAVDHSPLTDDTQVSSGGPVEAGGEVGGGPHPIVHYGTDLLEDGGLLPEEVEQVEEQEEAYHASHTSASNGGNVDVGEGGEAGVDDVGGVGCGGVHHGEWVDGGGGRPVATVSLVTAVWTVTEM